MDQLLNLFLDHTFLSITEEGMSYYNLPHRIAVMIRGEKHVKAWYNDGDT